MRRLFLILAVVCFAAKFVLALAAVTLPAGDLMALGALFFAAAGLVE
jgi:hypothetical protein